LLYDSVYLRAQAGCIKSPSDPSALLDDNQSKKDKEMKKTEPR